jgi:hypothetical protein
MQTLDEKRKEIELLMKYAVPEVHLREAAAFVETYAADTIVLNLLHNFYSYLPDAIDDGVRRLRLLARRQGTFLFCATTFCDDYLYIVTPAEAFCLGKLADGIADDEVLEFFGFADRLTFANRTSDLDALEIHTPVDRNITLCPICAVAEGEYHTLGCPVEICPWCGGQLTRCNCRFDQLDLEQLRNEADIEVLLERLEAAGRIAFDSAQRPAYPTMDDNEDEAEPELI